SSSSWRRCGPMGCWTWPGRARSRCRTGYRAMTEGSVDAGPSRTLAQKIWDRHVVRSAPGEPDLLFIDLHLVHEVTSPQAFEALRLGGRRVRRPDLTVATMDHNT